MKPAILAISVVVLIHLYESDIIRIVVHAYSPTYSLSQRHRFSTSATSTHSSCKNNILSTVRVDALSSLSLSPELIGLRSGLRLQYCHHFQLSVNTGWPSIRSRTKNPYNRNNIFALRLADDENSKVEEKEDNNDIDDDIEYNSNADIPGDSPPIIEY